MPKFFLQAGSPAINEIIGDEDPYFTGIKSFEHWDKSYVGMKAKLEIEINKFRESQLKRIARYIKPSDIFYHVAVSSVTESCSWVLLLVQYVDTTYREYERSKFSPKKAWHVTTRLARQLILKVFVPKHGIPKDLNSGDPVEIGKTIFWTLLQCLDIMSSIRERGFENDVSVSSELVKYLAINTEFDTIKRLALENASLKEEINSLKKDLQSSIKTASTLANKVDNVKVQVDNQNKRLKAVEKP